MSAQNCIASIKLSQDPDEIRKGFLSVHERIIKSQPAMTSPPIIHVGDGNAGKIAFTTSVSTLYVTEPIFDGMTKVYYMNNEGKSPWNLISKIVTSEHALKYNDVMQTDSSRRKSRGSNVSKILENSMNPPRSARDMPRSSKQLDLIKSPSMQKKVEFNIADGKMKKKNPFENLQKQTPKGKHTKKSLKLNTSSESSKLSKSVNLTSFDNVSPSNVKTENLKRLVRRKSCTCSLCGKCKPKIGNLIVLDNELSWFRSLRNSPVRSVTTTNLETSPTQITSKYFDSRKDITSPLIKRRELELHLRHKKRFSDTSTDKSPSSPNSFYIKKINSLDSQKRLKEKKDAILSIKAMQEQLKEATTLQELNLIRDATPKNDVKLATEEDKQPKAINPLQIPKPQIKLTKTISPKYPTPPATAQDARNRIKPKLSSLSIPLKDKRSEMLCHILNGFECKYNTNIRPATHYISTENLFNTELKEFHEEPQTHRRYNSTQKFPLISHPPSVPIVSPKNFIDQRPVTNLRKARRLKSNQETIAKLDEDYRKQKAYIMKKLNLKKPRIMLSNQILAYSGPAVAELLSERFTFESAGKNRRLSGKEILNGITSHTQSVKPKAIKSSNTVFKYMECIEAIE